MRPAGYRLTGVVLLRKPLGKDEVVLEEMREAMLFADAQCCASICSIVALVGAAATGFFRASLGGQAVCDWYLAMTIISTLLLLACVYICHCAFYYSPIPEVAEVKKYVKKTALPKALREARGGERDYRRCPPSGQAP